MRLEWPTIAQCSFGENCPTGQKVKMKTTKIYRQNGDLIIVTKKLLILGFHFGKLFLLKAQSSPSSGWMRFCVLIFRKTNCGEKWVDGASHEGCLL
jgi:hypothetical protein